MWIKGLEHLHGVLFNLDTINIMKKPKTQLGKRIAMLLSNQGEDYALIASAKEYDTFQIATDGHQVMDIVCHNYPNLAHGVLIHSRSSYDLHSDDVAPVLISRANNANLKSTSVITAIETFDNKKAFAIHFKSFVHTNQDADIEQLFSEAIKLHQQEISGVILPYFENIDAEVQDTGIAELKDKVDQKWREIVDNFAVMNPAQQEAHMAFIKKHSSAVSEDQLHALNLIRLGNTKSIERKEKNEKN